MSSIGVLKSLFSLYQKWAKEKKLFIKQSGTFRGKINIIDNQGHNNIVEIGGDDNITIQHSAETTININKGK